MPSVPGAEDNSADTVRFSLLTNGLLLVGFVLAYELLLRRRDARGQLAPKLPAPERVGVLCSRFPSLLSGGFCAWAASAWQSRHQPLDLEPDALILVRFCQLGLKFSLLGTALSLILLPMYATGPGEAAGFNVLSLSNLKIGGSTRFWCVVVAAYMLTSTFAYLVLAEWRVFVSIRRQHFVKAVSGACGAAAAQTRRSLMVQEVPENSWSDLGVTAFFERIYGRGAVYCCTRAGTCDSSSGSAGLGLGLNAQPAAQLLQAAGVAAVGSTAFVTLRSAEQCVAAPQVVLSHAPGWQVCAAPEPRDLVWQNVTRPLAQTKLHHRLGMAATVLCMLFWSVPVTLIQAWANIGTLSRWFPAVTDLKGISPTAYSFLTSYLPVLALMGLQACLPAVFGAMAQGYEGHTTKSRIQRTILSRCFSYQLASLYVTVLSGSLWDSLQEILDHPQQVLDILAHSLPKANVYFLTFVLARACTGIPFLLLHTQFFCSCRRDAQKKIACAYGYEASNIALVFVIGLSYSFIAPAILPVCAVYFAFAALCYRWLFLYVYDAEFDSGGAFWYDLFNCVLVGLLLSTLSLLGLAALYGTYMQLLALLPLPFLVVYLALHCWKSGWKSRWTSLEDAVQADESDSVLSTFDPDLYKEPQ
ncbi:unnamed protein product [Effrenium voratum]|uniref:Uncharacterized protein n=1 Tax=Effrenium voratum TaxID=2562239 RepID=A0AA36JPA7_9DINO|nr:unnamed protein product [Effrenium voratum]CAJ1409215.1 unnamed protein product [Effrenium voratum]CAJ1427671.1 unnamed protein product [Effrenium voratum]